MARGIIDIDKLNHALDEIQMAIYNAEPIIRCKDCKYFTRDSITGVTIPGTEYCIFTMNNRIEENDFCSRAEKKDEYVTLYHEDIHFINEDAERAFYESLTERKEE